jgi:SPX domain protein involved in polyphosphate accumulation
MIFGGFDTTYDSVNKSIDLQIKFLDTIDKNLDKVEAYKVFIENKLVELTKRLEETTDEKEKMKLEMFIRNVEYFK